MRALCWSHLRHVAATIRRARAPNEAASSLVIVSSATVSSITVAIVAIVLVIISIFLVIHHEVLKGLEALVNGHILRVVSFNQQMSIRP